MLNLLPIIVISGMIAETYGLSEIVVSLIPINDHRFIYIYMCVYKCMYIYIYIAKYVCK